MDKKALFYSIFLPFCIGLRFHTEGWNWSWGLCCNVPYRCVKILERGSNASVLSLCPRPIYSSQYILHYGAGYTRLYQLVTAFGWELISCGTVFCYLLLFFLFCVSLCLQFMFVDLTIPTGLMVYCPLRCASCSIIFQYLWRPVVCMLFWWITYTHSVAPGLAHLDCVYLALCKIVSMSWAGLFFFFLQCFVSWMVFLFFVVLKKRHRWYYKMPASQHDTCCRIIVDEMNPKLFVFSNMLSGSVHPTLFRAKK